MSAYVQKKGGRREREDYFKHFGMKSPQQNTKYFKNSNNEKLNRSKRKFTVSEKVVGWNDITQERSEMIYICKSKINFYH